MHHKNSKHNDSYDFTALCNAKPALSEFVVKNPKGIDTINFFDPEAVKALNKSLLIHHYGISYWDIPEGYLCPPVPGRADYLHHLNDLFKGNPKTDKANIRVLDIGVGANCIYPIIGVSQYGWNFVGSDVHKPSLDSAQKIIDDNKLLKDKVILRKQNDDTRIYDNVVDKNEFFEACICNPPFHASKSNADQAALRKLKNLKANVGENEDAVLNFQGRKNELYRAGGEETFINDMIFQSRDYKENFYWFTTLVSKESTLNKVERSLRRCKVMQVELLDLSHGNKSSRVLCWSYF